MTRRAARVAAVEMLYAADIREVPASQLVDEDAHPYTKLLVSAVCERQGEIDRLLAEHAIGWRPERMSPVDRNVLRVGALEILQGEVPAAALIDEAVEIAKSFSGAEAGRFVNGVLAAILAARPQRSETEPPAQDEASPAD